MKKALLSALGLLAACLPSLRAEELVEIERRPEGIGLRVLAPEGKPLSIITAPALNATTFNYIVFDGNSIIAGNRVPGSEYWRILSQSIGVPCTNVAFGGSNGAQLLARFDTTVAPLFRPDSIIVFEMGINDLVQGTSVEEVKKRHDDYILKCLQTGWTIDRIFIRPISANYFAGNYTTANRTAVNNYLLTNYPACTLNPASEPRIFALGANNNTNYFGDLTHPNEAGTVIDAAAMFRHIASHAWMPVESFTRAGDILHYTEPPTNTARFFRTVLRAE